MKIHIVLETSLGFDPNISAHGDAAAAQAAMARILVAHGWPKAAADDIARTGGSALVTDKGDDHSICILETDLL